MQWWNKLVDAIHLRIWKRIGISQDRQLEKEIRRFYPGNRQEIRERAERLRKKQIHYVLIFAISIILLIVIIFVGRELIPSDVLMEGNGYEESSIYGAFLLLTGVFVYLILADRNRLKEKGKERSHQLKEDYPVFVHKLVLYLGAGMNLRNTFVQISKEYSEDFETGQTESRYVYEELRVMMNEMQAGSGEIRAYESFGRRLDDRAYDKLISLLIQNLQKGTEGLLRSLETEESNAFLMRIDMAKRSGEEAATKLLFPMILMLVVVMVIVMAPALFQFGGM